MWVISVSCHEYLHAQVVGLVGAVAANCPILSNPENFKFYMQPFVAYNQLPLLTQILYHKNKMIMT